MSSKMIALSFRSADRDKKVHPNANDFVMPMGRDLRRVREVRLGSIEMPVTQNNVEDACSKFYYDEGIRVDVGEAERTVAVTSGGLAPVNTPLWNHQFCITERHGPALRRFILTVPPHLLEVDCVSVNADLTPSVTDVPTEQNIPHGLGVYQQWAASTATAPEIIGVATCTQHDIVYSSAVDVVAGTTPNANEDFRFRYTANVLNAKLALGGTAASNDFECVRGSFIHCPALHAHELASYLTTAAGLARDFGTATTFPLNRYRFQFANGRFQIVLDGPPRTLEGVASDPRLWFPTTPNSAAVTPNNPTVTSLGHIMGFPTGAVFRSQTLFAHPPHTGKSVHALVANASPRCFVATVGNGFYDPSSFATALVNEQNWGYLSNTTSGVPHTVFGEFGHVDSLGNKHTILVRSGKYFPHELATALAYQMTYLDGANTTAGGILTATTALYTGTYDPTASTFTFSCANGGLPLDFALLFDTSMFVQVSGVQNTDRIAYTLGFDPCAYSGSDTYTGKAVNIPRYAQTLSAGPSNSVVRPLEGNQADYSNSGPAGAGDTGGPAAFQYATNIFRIIGTNPNQKRYCPHEKAPLALNETDNPTTLTNGDNLGNYVALGPTVPGATISPFRHAIEFQSKVVTLDSTGVPPRFRSTTGPLGLQVGDVVRFFENPRLGGGAAAATFAALKISASGAANNDTVMPFPQTGVVVEIRAPVPFGATNPGSSANVMADKGDPSNVIDGARVRVRIANYLFWTAANAHGYNLDSLTLADPPRFQIHQSGRGQYSGQRDDALTDKLGVDADLFGAGLYLCPSQWNLDPVPYVLLVLSDPHATSHFHTHHTTAGGRSVLAKLIMSSPYTNVHNQIMQMGFDGYRNVDSIRIQILNPDGSPYNFHGRDFTMSLCFVVDADDVAKPCL